MEKSTVPEHIQAILALGFILVCIAFLHYVGVPLASFSGLFILLHIVALVWAYFTFTLIQENRSQRRAKRTVPEPLSGSPQENAPASMPERVFGEYVVERTDPDGITVLGSDKFAFNTLTGEFDTSPEQEDLPEEPVYLTGEQEAAIENRIRPLVDGTIQRMEVGRYWCHRCNSWMTPSKKNWSHGMCLDCGLDLGSEMADLYDP